MGIDIGGIVNNTVSWFCTESWISKTVRNPVGAALILLVIVVIIILANYDLLSGSENAKTKFIKMAVYMFIAMTIFLFVHYTAVSNTIIVGTKKSDEAMLVKKLDAVRGMGMGETCGLCIEGKGFDDTPEPPVIAPTPVPPVIESPTPVPPVIASTPVQPIVSQTESPVVGQGLSDITPVRFNIGGADAVSKFIEA